MFIIIIIIMMIMIIIYVYIYIYAWARRRVTCWVDSPIIKAGITMNDNILIIGLLMILIMRALGESPRLIILISILIIRDD